MTDRIEPKVSETILQKIEEIVIGGKTYAVAPATVATLIEVSELVSKLPAVYLNPDDIALETLYIAKDCRVLGDIGAVLILGAKNLRTRKEIVIKRFWGLKKETVIETVDNVKELSEILLLEYSPLQLRNLIEKMLKKMEVDHFFGLTTSLIEINLLRETREVEKATMTASGQ